MTAVPIPSPAPPDLVRIERMFANAEAELNRQLNDVLRRGPEWFREERRLRALLEATRAHMENLRIALEDEDFAAGLGQVYAEGATTQEGILQQAFQWNNPHLGAVSRIASDTFSDLLTATEYVEDSAKQIIRQAAKLATGSKLLTGKTAIQAGNRLAKDLRASGIGVVTYRNGARHGVGEYSRMVLRTKTAVAYNAGTLNFAVGAGVRVFEIFDGSDCGLSFHDDPTLANGLVVPADVAATYVIAHPNCRRSFGARPDIERLPDGAPQFAPSTTAAQRADQAAFEKYLRESQGRRPRRGRASGPGKGPKAPRSPRKPRGGAPAPAPEPRPAPPVPEPAPAPPAAPRVRQQADVIEEMRAELRATLDSGIEEARTVYSDGAVASATGSGHEVALPSLPGRGFQDSVLLHTHPFEVGGTEPSALDVVNAVRWPVKESRVITREGEWRIAYDHGAKLRTIDEDRVRALFERAERAGLTDAQRAAEFRAAAIEARRVTDGRLRIEFESLDGKVDRLAETKATREAVSGATGRADGTVKLGDSFTYTNRGAEDFRSLMDQIDELHGILPIEDVRDAELLVAQGNAGKGAAGYFGGRVPESGRLERPKFKPKSRTMEDRIRETEEHHRIVAEWEAERKTPRIQVDDSTSKGKFAFSHEVGHRVDYLRSDERDVPIYFTRSTRGFASINQLPKEPGRQAMLDFLEAVKETEALKAVRLATVRRKALYDYVTDPAEIWARAYSQWVEGQIGDGSLRAGLDYFRNEVLPGYQWSDEEFERVVKPALERVLRERGMMR